MRAHQPCSKSSLQGPTWLSALQVLDVINSAERALFKQQPELADAQVFVHLTSHVEVRRPAVPMAAQQAFGSFAGCHLAAEHSQSDAVVQILRLWLLPCGSAFHRTVERSGRLTHFLPLR